MTKPRAKSAKQAKQLLPLKQPAAADTAFAVSEQNGAAAAPIAETVRRSIEEAAYYRAEKRGFEPGYDVDDWLAAEAEITGCSLQQSAPAVALH